MSGIDEGPPPEVPEEYAATYRDAYRRALDEAADPAAAPAEDLIPLAPGRTRPVLAPLLVGGVVVLVVAVVIGLNLASGSSEPSATPDPVGPGPTVQVTPTPTTSTRPSPTPTPTPALRKWKGPVSAVAVETVTAACTSAPSVDAAGAPVEYDAVNTLDGDPTTAWRCDGEAVGETLQLVLPAGTTVAEVGLIPGYAKTDPASGVDRFKENNRITRVRWTFEDGTTVLHKLDPTDRSVQRLRIPPTVSGTVALEILAVERGSRDRTAISEIEVGSAD